MDVKDSISVTLKTLEGKEAKDQSAKTIRGENAELYTTDEAPATFDILF